MNNKNVSVWLLKWNMKENKYVNWKKYMHNMPIPRIGEAIIDQKENELYEVKNVIYVTESKQVGIYLKIQK